MPATYFSLTGKVIESEESPKNWIANFSPASSPILNLGFSYQRLNLSYSSTLNRKNSFKAIEIDVPVGLMSYGVFWRQYSGFEEQTKLRDADESSSSVSFTYGEPTHDSHDVKYLDAGLRAQLKLPGPTLPIDNVDGTPSNAFLDVNFLASADLQRESLSSKKSLVPSNEQTPFGSGADLMAHTRLKAH